MARPPKRRSLSASQESDDSDGGSPLKRVKLESREAQAGTSGALEEDYLNEGIDEESEGSEGGEDFADDAANVQAFEEARKRQQKYASLGSDVGVIKQIVLIDFMCHRHLKVDFGPHMNFLVGHNGSGKSAILTGIAIALGGKAAITGRGSGIKDLIRKGCEKAVITVTVCNEGAGAFKPDVYNPNIVIERIITKNGGGYKFRSSREGRIVATKRDELTQILAAFNLNIDSPLTILTQDQARSFLSNADEAQLYRFFLKGTQLQALSESYEQTERQFEKLRHFTTRSREMVPDLEARVATLQRKVNASRKIVEQGVRRKQINNEMAWAYVKSKEKERDEAQAKLDALSEKLEGIDEQIDKTEIELKPMHDQIAKMEHEVQNFDKSREPLDKARRQAKVNHDRLLKELQSLNYDEKDIERKVKSACEEIQELEENLAIKMQARDDGRDPKQIENQQRLTKMETALRKFQQEVPLRERQVNDLDKELYKAQDAVADIDHQLGGVNSQIMSVQDQLSTIQRQSSNRLSAYGDGVNLVLDEIAKARWQRGKPVGPMGLFVQLEDRTYRAACESLLGSMMCTWVVQCDTDRETLRRILADCRRRGYKAPGVGGLPTVFTNSGDIFDYSAGDNRRYGPTVLTKLRFSDSLVERAVINQSKIEKIFVAPDNSTANKEMGRLLGQGLPTVVFLTADGYRQEGTVKSRSSNPLQPWRGGALFSQDLAADINATAVELAEREREKKALLHQRTAATGKVNELKAQLAESNRKLNTARKGITSFHAEIDKLNEELSIQPSDEIDALEESKRDMLRRRDAFEGQRNALLEDKKDLQKRLDTLLEEVREVEAKLEVFMPERERRANALIALAQRRAQLQTNQEHWTKAQKTTQIQRVEAETALEGIENELRDWTSRASEYCPRIETNRSPKDLKAESDALEKAIAEAERRQGISMEDLTPQFNEAQKKLEDTRRMIKSTTELQKTGEMALKARKKWWGDMRTNQTVRTRCAFIINCQKRNLEGRLHYDHQKALLSVRVYPPGSASESQAGPTQHKFKTPKHLSGGERSFATVSLLLAMWDTNSSPIRCLDEWDVFLDHVNRKIAAGMLIDGAKESDGKQFILITPQDMSGVQSTGPGNKVIRLSDPTRNQGTLSFPAA